jgi:hypothetical protein
VVVAPDDVPADHAGLLLVGGVVGAVEGEVAHRSGFYASPWPPLAILAVLEAIAVLAK